MTVAELIKQLRKMPPAAAVRYVWDGEARTDVELIWLARCGDVILHGDNGEPVYTGEDRPITAPTEKEDPYWGPPGQPDNGKESL